MSSHPETQTTNDLEAVAEAIRSHERFAVTTHENPDGDALGSLLAMHLALRDLVDHQLKEGLLLVGGRGRALGSRLLAGGRGRALGPGLAAQPRKCGKEREHRAGQAVPAAPTGGHGGLRSPRGR